MRRDNHPPYLQRLASSGHVIFDCGHPVSRRGRGGSQPHLEKKVQMFTSPPANKCYKEKLNHSDCWKLFIQLWNCARLGLIPDIPDCGYHVFIYQVFKWNCKMPHSLRVWAHMMKSLLSLVPHGDPHGNITTLTSVVKLTVFKMSSTVFLLSWAATIATVGLFLSGM